MSNIQKEITDAINKHLPTEVGSLLQQRLTQADADARKIIELTAQLADSQTKRGAAEALGHQANQLKDRETKLINAENKLALDQAVLTAVTAERTLRMDDLKAVTLAVFANAKFKYWKSESYPVVVPDGQGRSYVASSQQQESGERES